MQVSGVGAAESHTRQGTQRLIGIFPASVRQGADGDPGDGDVHVRSGGSREISAGIWYTSSFDGINWLRPCKLLPSASVGPRVVDHPVGVLPGAPGRREAEGRHEERALYVMRGVSYWDSESFREMSTARMWQQLLRLSRGELFKRYPTEGKRLATMLATTNATNVSGLPPRHARLLAERAASLEAPTLQWVKLLLPRLSRATRTNQSQPLPRLAGEWARVSTSAIESECRRAPFSHRFRCKAPLLASVREGLLARNGSTIAIDAAQQERDV